MDGHYTDYSRMIDHALLAPTLTQSQIEEGIELAIAYDVASVCIMPSWLPLCVERLRDSDVKPSTVIGFPLGSHSTAVKQAEAECALADGAVELDAVVNISRVLSEDWNYVAEEIRVLTDLAHFADQKVKWIFENCYLPDSSKIRLCQICSELDVDWVKTSTGFGSGGSTPADLDLMRMHIEDHVQLKAAGGIRTFDDLLDARERGASRCGASGTAEILNECRDRLGLEPLPWVTVNSSGY